MATVSFSAHEVRGEVVALGPRNRGFSTPFIKQGSKPVPFVWSGYPDQCVHSTFKMPPPDAEIPYGSFVRCEARGSKSHANGYLCQNHQGLCEPSQDSRKVKQSIYMGNRDFDQELVESIIQSEYGIINQLDGEKKIIKLGKRLFVEADRQLAPLPTGAFDGVWENIDLSPLDEGRTH